MELPTPDDIAIRLPAALWEQIFSHVSVLQLLHVRLTCRSWRTIVDGCPALMKRMLLKFPEEFVLDREYEPDYLVPARNLALPKVRISAVDPWWPGFARRLVSLSLNRCKVSLGTLVGLLRPMASLRELKLCDLRMLKRPRSYPRFALPLVEKLSLTDMAEGTFRYLLPMFPRLKCIDFPEDLDDTLLKKILQRHKNTLEGIRIRYRADLLDEILQLKRLTHVAFPEGGIGNKELTEIGKKFPKLKSITVEVDAEADPLGFLATMPALEVLNLEATDEYQRAIFDESTKLTKLTKLKLSYFLLKSSTLNRLLSNSPHIVEINFTTCKFHDWFEVFAVLELYCRTLQRLTLEAVEVVYDDDRLSEYFDRLRFLKLCDCKMSKALVTALVSLCPQLEEVHLELMGTVDDDVVQVLGRKLKRLEKLALVSCGRVTDVSAIAIVKHFHALKQLIVSNCPTFSSFSEQLVKKKMPNVRVI